MSWKRAFEKSPCPICGKTRWCTATDDGKVVNCTRTPNDRPIANRSTGEVIGYRHRVGEAATASIRRAPPERAAEKLTAAAVQDVHRQHHTAVNPHRLRVHAKLLGVTVDALAALAIGWDVDRQAWTFPMVDAAGAIVGLRYRRDDGAKWSLRGGREGVFLPAMSRTGPVVICEGPTSAAAWLSLGFDVIGRPSCQTGGMIIATVARRLGRPLLIVADRDSRKTRPNGSHFYPGQDGARALHEQLRGVCTRSWAVCPVPKDARDWIKRGATRATVLEWIGKHAGGPTRTQPASVKRSA